MDIANEAVETKGLQLEHTSMKFLLCVSCFYDFDISLPSILSMHIICIWNYAQLYCFALITVS